MACLAVAGDLLQRLGWRYSGGAEGASLLLGTVAGSMIAIAQIAGHVQRGQDAACLQRHASMIVRGAREAVPEADDVRAVEARLTAALQALREFRS